MKIGAFNIDVFILLLEKEEGRNTVDDDAYACHPGNGFSGQRLWIKRLVDGLESNSPNRDEQDHRIEQRNQDGSFAITVSDCRPDLVAMDNPIHPKNYIGKFYLDALTHDAAHGWVDR